MCQISSETSQKSEPNRRYEGKQTLNKCGGLSAGGGRSENTSWDLVSAPEVTVLAGVYVGFNAMNTHKKHVTIETAREDTEQWRQYNQRLSLIVFGTTQV